MTADPASAETAPITATGRFFDGVSARPHPVTVQLADRIRVSGSGIHRDWDPLELRATVSVPPLMRLGPVEEPCGVEFSDDKLYAELAARCPNLHRREGSGGTWRLVLCSIAAGLSVLLVAVFGMPRIAGLIVPLVPDAAESRLGAMVEPQILRILGDPKACMAPAGREVLEKLVARFVAAAGPWGALPPGLTVSVRRHGTANAFALPGARVIVLSNLITRARTPDEVAAVLAHELGHVQGRDPTRSLIQASGTSFLLSLVLGDLTGSTIIIGLSNALLSAGYSREAERAADTFAVDLMTRAGGNAAALADILERIAKDEKGGLNGALAILRSHPLTRERAAAIRARAGPDAPGRAILSANEWAALQGICGPKTPTLQP